MQNLSARFWSKVDKTDTCWLWQGPPWSCGYGTFTYGPNGSQVKIRPFKFAYADLVGDVPQGLVLDHLCSVRLCVNPDHLEPVTVAENSRRANALKIAKTHCKHGHAFTPENTYIKTNGTRECRSCSRAAGRRYEARKRLAKLAA